MRPSEASDRIRKEGTRCPEQPDYNTHKEKLSGLDTDVEGQKSSRNVALWQPDLSQRTRKSKSVQQTEGEGNNPGKTLREAGLTILMF